MYSVQLQLLQVHSVDIILCVPNLQHNNSSDHQVEHVPLRLHDHINLDPADHSSDGYLVAYMSQQLLEYALGCQSIDNCFLEFVQRHFIVCSSEY